MLRLPTLLLVVLRPVLSEETPVLTDERPVLTLLRPVLTEERPVLTLLRPVLTLLNPVEVEVNRLVTLLFVVLRPVLRLETCRCSERRDARAQAKLRRPCSRMRGPVLTLLRPVLSCSIVEVEVDRLVTLLFVVLRPVNKLPTLLLVVLRPVLSEQTPVLNDDTPVLTLTRVQC